MRDFLKPFAVMAFVLVASFLIQAKDPLNSEAAAYARDVRTVMKSTMTFSGQTNNSLGLPINIMLDQETTRQPYIYLYIENEETTHNLFCSDNPMVTTTGVLRGKKILPAGNFSWTIPAGSNWYCACGGSDQCLIMVGRGW